MSSFGISVGLANFWLNTLRNVPFVVPITCLQLHTGIPGADGTANGSLVTTRSQGVFTGASLADIGLTGDLPTWLMTHDETINYLSVWSGFDGDTSAFFLFSLPVTVPPVVANGDKLILNSCDINFKTRAA